MYYKRHCTLVSGTYKAHHRMHYHVQPLRIGATVVFSLALLACSNPRPPTSGLAHDHAQAPTDVDAATFPRQAPDHAALGAGGVQVPQRTQAPPMPDRTAYMQAQRASVARAQAGDRPERLDRFGLPPRFDPAVYLARPESYLNDYDVRRIRAVSDDSAAPRLACSVPRQAEVPAGGHYDLIITTAPWMPVTVLSTGMGTFDNDLSVFTAAADAHGQATIRFRATAGTYGPVCITAASPAAQDTVDIQLDVVRPSESAPIKSGINP